MVLWVELYSSEICWSPNSYYAWMWSFLDIMSCSDQIKRKSLGWALIWYDWCIYKKGKSGHRDKHTVRMPHEDWNFTSTSQGMPKTGGRPPESKREAWDKFFLTALRKNHPWWRPDFGLLAPRPTRQYISLG